MARSAAQPTMDEHWASRHIGLSGRAIRLLREARWIVLCFLAIFLFLILASYNPVDPGWSHAVTTRQVHNLGGRVGAWFADLILYLFGMSAYLFSFFLILRVLASYRQLHREAHLARRLAVSQAPARSASSRARGRSAQTETPDSRPPVRFAWERWIGFILLLVGCSALEGSRLYNLRADLPLAPGGLLGALVSGPVHVMLGAVGGTLALLLLIAIGFSLATGVSWMSIFERTGAAIDYGITWLRQAMNARADRQAGIRAARQRGHLLGHSPAALDLDGDESGAPLIRPARAGRAVTDDNVTSPPLAGEEDVSDDCPETSAAPDGDSAAGGSRGGLFSSLLGSMRGGHGHRGSLAERQAAVEPTIADPDGARAPFLADDDSPVGRDEDFPSPESPVARRQARPVSGVSEPSGNAGLTVGSPREPVRETAMVSRPQPAPVFQHPGADSPLPDLALLDAPPATVETMSPETLEYTSRLIEKKLSDFGITATVVHAYPGPVITRYEIEPATGVKGSQIVNLAKDLARSLSVISLRVVETIPGKNLMGLELPNPRRQGVRLSEIIGSRAYVDAKSPVTVSLGKDIAGNPVVADLARMPHLLVAGTTGSGKSVGINAMLMSILYKADPSQVRMILIDPKMLEMSVYEGIPHLLAPVVTDMRQAGHALNWCVGEMERRYKLMSKLGVRNLVGYNAKIADAEKREELIPNPFSLTPDAPEPLQKLPIIVVVIDELADLMMVVGKKIEELIARLAQKARAAGIHLILATQRPSVDVITGLIKANIPSRIAFQVSSKIDSRTILDQMGAETLLGQGDMLYLPAGTNLPQRVHGAYVADEEVHKVVASWLEVGGEPNYIEGILEGGVPDETNTGSAVGFGGLSSTLAEAGMDGESDAMYDQAVAIVLQHRRASISLVQRHLRIGYNRAARLLEQMERSGIVSAMTSNGNRDILVPAHNHAGDKE